MKLNNLALIVTENCNFNCVYCPQKKQPKDMTTTIIDRSIAFFRPYLEAHAFITFYGGEPLLVFDKVVHTVTLIEKWRRRDKKKFHFSLTTNGTLLDDNMLAFFNRHRFLISLSYDGQAHDRNRRTGTAADTMALIPRFKEYPGINFSINSVFTPDSIGTMTESVKQMVEAGADDIAYNLNNIEPWRNSAQKTLEQELQKMGDYLAAVHKKTGAIPLENFRPPDRTAEKKKHPFACSAGRSRISVSPDGIVWGCHVFPDFFKGKEDSQAHRCYSFGGLDEFIENYDQIYPRVMENYSELRQDFFSTEKGHCFLCEYVNDCSICPITGAHATGKVGSVPLWCCKIKAIQRTGKDRFLKSMAAPAG